MNKYLLSICVPTYNRAAHLRNCLNSLIQSGVAAHSEVQICISDNCSTDDTKQVIDDVSGRISLKYQKNAANIGLARNLLEVVQMAEGEFVWMIGDDDLVMPQAGEMIINLIRQHKEVDYFYANANHLTTEYVHSFPQPFSLDNLPKKMEPFSPRVSSGELPFLKLIDPQTSFDFLGGIFLSVFRRTMWLSNVDVLDKAALMDAGTYSHFDNTFPHVKIFAKAFAHSRAYFCAQPASVCLKGAREWMPLYPLVRSVRLIEALGEYRKNGLTTMSYIYCKNAALAAFFPDMAKLVLHKARSGYAYVNLPKIMLANCVYPNFYFSLVYPIFQKSFWNVVKKQLFFK